MRMIGIQQNKRAIPWHMCLIVAATNLSQLPRFVDSGTTQYLTYVCWGSLLYYMLRGRLVLSTSIVRLLFCVLGIVLALGFQTMITGNAYYNTRIFYSLLIATGILLLSHIVPEGVLRAEQLNDVYLVYILSSTILAIVVYFDSFFGRTLFTNTIYEYGSKNSTAQIFITAVTLGIFVSGQCVPKWRRRILFCIAVNLVMLFILRSRASLIGLVLIIAAVTLNKQVDKRIKRMVWLGTAAFCVFVLLNEEAYDTVVNKIILGSRKANNLDELSSGRFSQWQRFPKLFWDALWFGRGRYKIESFPLSVLVQLGLFSGLAVIYLGFYPMIWSFKNWTRRVDCAVLFVTAAVYMLNGVFEELSPFGPGVKCYFIWFLLGILMRGVKNE